MLDVENAATSPSADALPPFRDDEGEIDAQFVEAVAEAVEAGDKSRVCALVEDLHEADVGGLLEALEPDQRPRLIELLGKEFDFTALTEVDDSVREEILEELETETVAEGLRELDADDAVAILEDLDPAEKDEILDRLPAPERVAIQRALDYPEDSAGRRMQTELIAVPPFWTVAQTLDFMRDADDLPETFYEIFVVDPGHRLLGSVPLDRLLRSKGAASIEEVMRDDDHLVRATDDQEDAARLFQRYNLVSAAVVDEGGRLVGVVMVDDIVDVLDEEADAEIKALGGVNAEEEISDRVGDIARSRFPWLLANSVTAVVSASVISLFEDSVEQMVALAVLMPIVASMGGNAGTQTMTVTVRALATRQLGRANTWRIVRREVVVGLINGLVFGLILGIVAALWFGVNDLGVVIGLALLAVLSVAAFGGILIPLLLHRLGVDPAVSSGPFVTTTTDIVGFFAFLGIATLWFRL